MTADLVPVDNMAALEQMDADRREVAVTGFLSGARDLLTQALAATNAPAAVTHVKAQLASVEAATRQFDLSREVRDDAAEMVRRAEYALGKAVREAQEAGVLLRPGEVNRQANQYGECAAVHDVYKGSVDDYFNGKRTMTETYALVDGVSDEQFDAALSEARDEGNLSRANVIRKVRGVQSDKLTRTEKARKIRDLAPTGMTSGQIAAELGVTEGYVRERARELGVEITADKVMARTHRVRVDSNHIVGHAVMTLEALITGFDRINTTDLDDAQKQTWTDSLTQSARALNRLIKQIKETIQ